ncbi:AfsA-related hotdog domain-containing protein [Erwinia sp. PsM31]|uniref:AfsA-related hotdog domain-containing protein n=1 Tax=Erwinia sp. PsM31 TaxID=3030535 RepID=UPI00263B3970|nr:AfsA-related hotdog domain-containing protein [Erwinia sp. PsM31]MDN4626089.1 AfsA-related hotdog domain-containing protein [Erwinia sp. PsM31]
MNLNNNKVNAKSTVDISLVHKLHKDEMFLLNCIPFDSGYKANARLSKHSYFCDHIKPLTDLMFILECARQAETYILHKYEHQSADTRFILTEWSSSISGYFTPTVDLLDENINLTINTYNSRRAQNKILSQQYKVDARLGHVDMATIYMSVKYMTDEAYRKIRNIINKNAQNQSEFIFNQSMNVSPEYVYRSNVNNIVIKAPQFKNHKVISSLTVNMNNTAYFDHPQDHYPAMVLMEAGKQNCQILIYITKLNSTPILTTMKSKFFHYAELDKDIQIISEEIPGMQRDEIEFNVLLVQKGKSIAEMVYLFKMIDI